MFGIDSEHAGGATMSMLTLPLRLAGALFSFLFVGGILEVLGMLLYLEVTDQSAAAQALMADGVQPGELLPFLLASPDRLLVAIGLAIVAVLFVRADSSGSGHHVGGFDGGFDGGFGGDGGDGGGGGGGGDGGGGGGGGGE
jgi:hypothetical protein